MISRKEICACMNIFEKIYRQYLSMAGSSEAKRKYLIKKGAKIGAGTIIHGALNTFGTEPYLIEVGVNCLFAYDVRLITHDGGVNVLNGGVITTIKDVIYIYETNIKDICNFWGDPCLWGRQGHMKKRMVSTVFTQSIN